MDIIAEFTGTAGIGPATDVAPPLPTGLRQPPERLRKLMRNRRSARSRATADEALRVVERLIEDTCGEKKT